MKHILLVEDNLDLSNLYEEMLTSAGYWVHTARDNAGASDAVKKNDIAFILLDIMLATNDNGLDFLEKLNQTDEGKAIPVVVLTNVGKDEEKDRAMKLGAKEYIVKAEKDPEDIVDIVKKYTSDDEDSKSN